MPSPQAACHGLLQGHPPPSRETLLQWLDRQGIKRDERLEIASMEDGSGWRVVAKDEMDLGELICAIPKSSILSHKTSSLPPLPELNIDSRSLNSYTILHLSLCLLHEFRLGAESPFYGYLQSLPREIIGLPLLWDIQEIGGVDGKLGKEWLKGTEVERELERRAEQGLSFDALEAFYRETCSHLPPTSSHPIPSPLISYLHCFALVSTRAFMIDIYHLISLCPFADIMNHTSASSSHTSMMADDFVCHACGSLAPCQHDITDPRGVPYRLAHLGEREIARIGREEDSVDMRVERPVIRGEEVWNCYGEGLGDARLLVEWGFISGDFTGEGLTWGVNELVLGLGLVSGTDVGSARGDDGGEHDEDEEDDDHKMGQYWSVVESVGSRFRTTFKRTHDARSNEDEDEDEDGHDDDDEEERLIRPPSEQDERILNLDQLGRLSINVFVLIWLSVVVGHSLPQSGSDRDRSRQRTEDQTVGTTSDFQIESEAQVEAEISRAIESLERAWAEVGFGSRSTATGTGTGNGHDQEESTSRLPTHPQPQPHTHTLDDRTRKVVDRIKGLLRGRLEGLYRSELSDEELFDLKDSLGPEDRYQDMAMTISINERILLRSALERWEQL
ncbi:hypothetical protein IAU59_005923 [Kwoniella sp. CBS 9459]